MGSAQSTPAATSYTRGARAEDKISSDDSKVQPLALAPLNAPFKDNSMTPLLDEVRKIGARAGKITARFDTIAAALKGAPDPRRSAGDVLYRMLRSLFKRIDPEKVELLRCQWFEIAQLRKETLWRSRNVAAVNAAKLKSFIENFIPYLQSDEDLDEKKAEISAYLEVNKKQDNEELQLQDEFKEIKKKLEEFEEEVQEACKTLSVASKRVKELESEIEALRGKIKFFIDEMNTALYGCDVTHEGVLGFFARRCFAHFMYLLLPADENVYTNAIRQIQDREDKKRTKEKERLAIYAEHPELDLYDVLNTIGPDLREAILDTATLCNIWGLIQADLIILNTRLVLAVSPAHQKLFSCHLVSLEKAYKCLHCALYEYAAALDTDMAAA